MIGRQERWQEDLFIAGPLRDLIPEDHLLKKVDKVLNLSWLRDEVRELYKENDGRPSIDPEAAVRLMLAGLFCGVVHDRKLMREAQVNLAIRWFAGYRLTDRLPDHSSLTRIRSRWGAEHFARIFKRSVSDCAAAGLVSGETVHFDATLIRADVSWNSITERHIEQVLTENPQEATSPPDEPSRTRKTKKAKTKKAKKKKYSKTDAEASLSSSCQTRRAEPSYKQHTAVDDRAGVVVAVEVTTGETHEGKELPKQIEQVEANTGTAIRTATADSAYAHGANFALLEKRGAQAIIPPQRERTGSCRMPLRRFKYDAHHDIVRCPAGRKLRRSTTIEKGTIYHSRRADCRHCPLRDACLPPRGLSRNVLIVNGYEALLRARRRHQRWNQEQKALYGRHRWRVEGIHGEAKTQHGLRRAVRRGLANVQVQVYLTAAVMNLKRLAALRAASPAYSSILQAGPRYRTLVLARNSAAPSTRRRAA